MDYKRLEIYVGWTCNQKCTYCMEFPNMEETWTKVVSKLDILKKLIKYKKRGYNHVTYLGGEPFIQPVFLDALKLGKKLGYTILVTTNATTLSIDKQASKFLPYIDQLFLSVEAIDKDLQQVISRTKVVVEWDKVFVNINKYWKGDMLKANIVITQDNKYELFNMVKFIHNKGCVEFSLTYPDIDMEYYGKEHILKSVAPTYEEAFGELIPIIKYCKDNKIHLKLPDFPFCIFPEKMRDECIKMTDDFDYETRIKVNNKDEEIDRGDLSNEHNTPRERAHIEECYSCRYKKKCWGPSVEYEELYGLQEISAIK